MYKKKLYIFGLVATIMLLIALASSAITAHLTRANLAQSQIAQALLTEHQQLSSISYRLFKQLTDELIFGQNANQAMVRNKQELIQQSIDRIRILEIEQRQALGEKVTQGSVEDTDELEALISDIIDEFRSIVEANDDTPLNQQARLQELLEVTIDNRFREAINSAVIRQSRVVSATNASIETLNTAIVWFTIGLGVIAGPFIILGCYWLFSALYQPLSVIQSGTRSIASGNYAYRFPENLDREFSELVKALNDMVVQLSEHEAQAAAYRKELEFEVESRTRELTEANKQLTNIDNKRRQFIADVSHELRTPLTIIRGEAQVTLRQASVDEQLYRDTLSAILEQSVNLSRLVDDLLLLVRAEMSQLKLERETCDFAQVILQLVKAWQRTHADREITFTCHESNTTVLMDLQRVEQAITIILDNALKYSDPGTPIELHLSRTDPWYCIAIKDHGCGISLAEQEHIFERFVRLNRNGSGVGLGLPIAKAIVEAHGGDITVSSRPGEGAIFTLRIPQVLK